MMPSYVEEIAHDMIRHMKLPPGATIVLFGCADLNYAISYVLNGKPMPLLHLAREVLSQVDEGVMRGQYHLPDELAEAAIDALTMLHEALEKHDSEIEDKPDGGLDAPV